MTDLCNEQYSIFVQIIGGGARPPVPPLFLRPCFYQASTVTLTYFSPQLLDLQLSRMGCSGASDCQLIIIVIPPPYLNPTWIRPCLSPSHEDYAFVCVLYPGTTFFRPPPNFDHLILCFTKTLIV